MKKFFIFFFFGACLTGLFAQSWNLTGNAGTTTSNFLGTSDSKPLIFKTYGIERMRLMENISFLGIGTPDPLAALHLHVKESKLEGETQLLRITTFETNGGTKDILSISSSVPTRNLLFKYNGSGYFRIGGMSSELVFQPNGNIVVSSYFNNKTTFEVEGNIQALSAMIDYDLFVKNSAIINGNITANGNIVLNGESTSRLSLGAANSKNLNWGTSYVGFNAHRINTSENWICLGDGSHNGGGVIYSNVEGNMYFVPIPHTGAYFQTLTDTQIKNNIKLTLTSIGNVGIGTTNPQEKLDVNGSFKAQSAYISGNTIISGNVGIGINPPQAKLEVAGQFKATSANITGALSAQSATITNNLTAYALNAQNATIATLTGNTNVTGTLSANLIEAPGANINGKIKTKEVEVTSSNWPDFVFENNYNLLPLSEVEQYIKENNRLPDIPSATEVEENGVELGSMQAKLLMKIEEMTLYILQQDKKITDLQNQINELKKQ